MKKKADLLDWIDRNNAEQIQWVNEYLARHLPSGCLEIYRISGMEIRAFNNTPVKIDADLILLINKMRAAWRQKVFRSKQNGKKTYSFVMSRGIEAKLKALSGKGEIRKTLEELIENVHKFTAPKINELKTKNQDLVLKISLLREENDEIRLASKSLNQDVNIKDNEIDTLKKEIKVLQQDYAYLLLELERLKENKPDDITMNNKESNS